MGFSAWVISINEQKRAASLLDEYIKTRIDTNSLFNEDLINATERFKPIFGELFLTKVFYQDFYSLPKFGKTKLGQWVLHGKQAQNKKIIQKLALGCKPILEKLCIKEKIDAIAWSPHSLLEKNLQFTLPKIEIVKAYTGSISIAQKTLSKLSDRIINARETIIIKTPQIQFKNILLIDDAVGSGATLNETAKKLIEKGAHRVVGFALVGSYKGFEIIKEV